MVVAQEEIDWQESLTPNPAAEISRPIKRRKRYAKRKSILALALIVGITGAIGAETIQLTVVKGAQVRSLEKDIAAVKAQNDLLQMQADKLRAVSRIESVALSMGMVKPAGTVYVASTVPAVKNQKGSPSTPAAMPANEAKPTALHQFSQLFTSFFASTQR